MYYNYHVHVYDISMYFISPDLILCGWLGLKHQLTNIYFKGNNIVHDVEKLPKSEFDYFHVWWISYEISPVDPAVL